MSQNEYSKEPHWYVVHTYSGYENKVKKDLENTIINRELQDYIFKIVVPMEEQIEIKNGKTTKSLKKVFPGYVLVKMIVTEKTWYIVRNTTGVTGFVGAGTNPIPLTDDEVRKMGFDTSSIKLPYSVGDSVEILVDPFVGYMGKVEDVNEEKQKVKVLVLLFGGRETSIELGFEDIK